MDTPTPATPTQTTAKKPFIKRFLPYLPLLIIVAFIGFSIYKSSENVDAAKVGDCTALQPGNDKKPYVVKDCSDASAQYKVIAIATAEQTLNRKGCKTIPGTTNTVSSKQGTLCMIAKNDNPANGINTIQPDDCMSINGSTGKKVACSSPDAEYTVLERFENVSKVAPGSKCNDVPGTTLYYGWGIEQTGGAYRITSVGYDLFFCLGRNSSAS